MEPCQPLLQTSEDSLSIKPAPNFSFIIFFLPALTSGKSLYPAEITILYFEIAFHYRI
jgi:hypothetical protein